MHNNNGAPVAYITTTEPVNTLEFQCFFCKKLMTKKSVYLPEGPFNTEVLQLRLKCPDHDGVMIKIIG